MLHDANATTEAQRPPSAACELLALANGMSRVVGLPSQATLVLGRADGLDVTLPHASVSRRHAALHVFGASITIEDLGSANGVFVDGARVAVGSVHPVALGAIVELGGVRLVVRTAGGDEHPSPMERVRSVVARVAPSDISVVLVGETGVGKEVLAEEVHRASLRAAGPLLKLNCAALPAHLLESELFGYERGAFTGAVQAKPGLFEAATGGTVLLDEIGELPEATQAKLLRVLESREVHRIGALRPRPVDVRFLAATHRDLDVLVLMGQFRQDLHYRINGITIQLPPLRDRQAEIPGLATALLADARARANKPARALTPEALALVTSYRWPGNVRELRNVLDRAVLLAEGDAIDVEHLVFGKVAAPPRVSPSEAPKSVQPPPSAAHDAVGAVPPTSERERIIAALAQCAGNQAEAAKLLGITRRVLGYRLDKLGVPRPRKVTRS